ncbi:MAG: hypothetical protein M3Q40_03625 [Pseudomonadota bacterium]|nr:hypothetical protein [Pseudomonadota bacterium]
MEASAGRTGHASVGWSVLLAWGLLMALAFALMWSTPRSAQAAVMERSDAALIGSWLQAQPGFRGDRASITWVEGAASDEGHGCGCPGIGRSQWPQLRNAWLRAGADVLRMPPPLHRPSRLSHVEIIIANTQGDPVYAGAFDSSPVCGGRTATDLMLASAVSTRAPSAAGTPAAPLRTSSPTCDCT